MSEVHGVQHRPYFALSVPLWHLSFHPHKPVILSAARTPESRLCIGMATPLINLLHDGPDIQRIAVRNHHIRNLAGIERAQLVAQPEDLRRIQRDRPSVL
jgi:hypothetical protein